MRARVSIHRAQPCPGLPVWRGDRLCSAWSRLCVSQRAQHTAGPVGVPMDGHATLWLNEAGPGPSGALGPSLEARQVQVK